MQNKNQISEKDSIEILSKEGINISNMPQNNNNNISNNINENLNSNNYNNHNSYNNNINDNNNNFKKNTFKSTSNNENIKTDLNHFKDILTFFSRYVKDPRTALIEFNESTQTKNDTSYLNAVLQLIGHIPNLAFYLLNPENKDYIENNIKKYPLTFVTERLFVHLYPYPEKVEYEVYNTHTYLKILGALNLFYNTEKTQRKNPNDLITFILDTLDKEINNGKYNSPVNYNKFDVNEVIKAGTQNFSNNVISKNLNWFQINESKCQKCQKSIYKANTFNTFNLDIVKCYNKKISQNANNEISLKDCLDIFQKETFQNLRCEICNNTFQKMLCLKRIFNTPNTFIFLLDRGVNFDNVNNLLYLPFKIEEEIDLDNNYIMNQKSSKRYKLTGIVSIFLKEKKYVSYCISPISKEWYFYNDEKVEDADINNIIQVHNIAQQFVPCVLAYKAIF